MDFLDYGLTQSVTQPTHGNHILDKVCTNRSDLFQADVQSSLIKTKHKAVYVEQAYSMKDRCSSKAKHGKFVVCGSCQHHLSALRYQLSVHNWSQPLSSHNLQMIYDEFLKVVKFYIKPCIRMKTGGLVNMTRTSLPHLLSRCLPNVLSYVSEVALIQRTVSPRESIVSLLKTYAGG